jgi:hypothetical protein
MKRNLREGPSDGGIIARSVEVQSIRQESTMEIGASATVLSIYEVGIHVNDHQIGVKRGFTDHLSVFDPLSEICAAPQPTWRAW